MKFKILELKQTGANLHVAVKHESCERTVFSFPLEFVKNNLYIAEIKKVLNEREQAKKVFIDEKTIGKEFNY